MNYNKPFRTYSEQIDILENKYKLIVDNKTLATEALETIGYYDLINGYKDCFMKNDEFMQNINFYFIYRFYILDKDIQSILLKYSIIIENSFKQKFANILAKNFGVHQDEYLNASKYFKSNNGKTFEEVKKHYTDVYTINKNKTYIPQPTKHYANNHNHIPPWILFKNVTFSNTINLIHLLEKTEKMELVNIMLPTSNLPYDQKVDFVLAALNIIRDFRNVIAHNLKFITHKHKKYGISVNTLNNTIGQPLVDVERDKKNTVALMTFMLTCCV